MRRLFWVALGLGAGVAGAIMSMRFVKKQTQRVAPAHLAREAKGGVMDVAKLFSESIAEGKRAMADKEAELRSGAEPPPDRLHDALPGHPQGPASSYLAAVRLGELDDEGSRQRFVLP